MKKLVDKIKDACGRWWREQSEPIAVAAGLALLLSLAGCAKMLTCETVVTHEAGKFAYRSCKNQENLYAKAALDESGKIKDIEVTTTATTPEVAMAGALAVQTELMRQLLPLLNKITAAMAGS